MIELNGIQISDNNINTRKNVKIYIDEKYIDIIENLVLQSRIEKLENSIAQITINEE